MVADHLSYGKRRKTQ